MRLVNPLSLQDLEPISCIVDTGPKIGLKFNGSVPIDHSHSQQPGSYPLFKRCEWLVINRSNRPHRNLTN